MPHTMTWEARYRWRQLLRTSLIFPASTGLISAIFVSMAIRTLDLATGWKIFNFSPDGARALLGTFVGSMLTFIVFVLSATLIVVQLASAQFSPRVISIVFAKPDIKWTLGILTFTFTYTLAALARIEDQVLDFHVGIATLMNLVCILAFFYFAQELAQGLRPNSLVQHIAIRGRKVIAQVYAKPYDATKPEQSGIATAGSNFTGMIPYAGNGGFVMAFSISKLVDLARQAGSSIQLVPQVGDFIAAGDPLFLHMPGSRPLSAAALHSCVAVGTERTLEQDPRFIFRILVDIASKALSPAINDPTTAVIALDQIDNLLQCLGKRHLGDGMVNDAELTLRLAFGTPDWPDFVTLAVSEIRQFGGSSIQVNRRLRAMLEHLLETLPQARHLPLRTELALLEAAARRFFPDEDDCRRALVADYQGLGGSET